MGWSMVISNEMVVSDEMVIPDEMVIFQMRWSYSFLFNVVAYT